jgi:2-polyprenyl-6-methoxyphenol hydroxylase-like FAD-dependent oxidoreductase
MTAEANSVQNGAGAPQPSHMTDIVIVGGGFAGCLAAIVLAKDGHKTTLVDLNANFPAHFRAEKISGDQLPLLAQFGLLDAFKAASTPATQAINIRGRHIVDRPPIEEYGMLYQDMVAVLRAHMPASVDMRIGKVVDIDAGDDRQIVHLASGETIDARLVVLATGHGEALRRKLGIDRRVVNPEQTVCVGFTLTPPKNGFAFPSLGAYGERCGDGVDYIHIFPLGDKMRANYFMFARARDPRVAALRERPLAAVQDMLPGLRPWIEGCAMEGDAELGLVDLYICDNVARSGVVLIGDSYRTSCPAVGSGLSCILVDVARLQEHARRWLATPGMAAEKIAAFYADPVKAARDRATHSAAFMRRKAVLETALAHRLRLWAHYAKRTLRDRLGAAAPRHGAAATNASA